MIISSRCSGFGPGTITRDESGRVVHGELHVGDGVIWMHPPSADYGNWRPRRASAPAPTAWPSWSTMSTATTKGQLAAGATVVYPPRDMDYGVREYAARDLEGGLWSFMTPLDPEGRTS